MDLSKLMFFSELLNVFVIVADMVLLKLLLGFVKVVLLISRLLPNKTKPKFDNDFKACSSFCFELTVMNAIHDSESKYSWSTTQCLGSDVLLATFKLSPIHHPTKAK